MTKIRLSDAIRELWNKYNLAWYEFEWDGIDGDDTQHFIEAMKFLIAETNQVTKEDMEKFDRIQAFIENNY